MVWNPARQGASPEVAWGNPITIGATVSLIALPQVQFARTSEPDQAGVRT